MATNTNWPLVVTQVAFNVGGNDGSTTPVWTDVSARLREFDTTRGRQYEIDQNQAGEASAVFSDKDEWLNPANASSPYAGQVLPYRPIIQQVMWPPAPVGAAVNLLNAAAGYDPGFESTPVGQVPPKVVAVQASPVVTTTNPRSGSRSLTFAVSSTGSAWYQGYPVIVIPGMQYTASVYVRQTAANATKLFVNGGASTATVSTTGSYFRLTLTFTASQPVHQLYVGTASSTATGNYYIDDWQLEVGASASAYNASGPTVYGIFRGFVERWPSSWRHKGLYGMCEVECVDPLAVLANTRLHTELAEAVLWLGPKYFWRLNEGQDATSFADSSGNAGPSLTRMDSIFGPADVYEPGSIGATPGDPGQSVVAINTPDVSPQPATVLQAGATYNGTPSQQISIGGNPPFGYSVVLVASRSETGPGNGRMLTLASNAWTNRLAEIATSAIPDVVFLVGPDLGLSVGVVTGVDPWADGKPHLFVMTVAVGVTNYVINAYVDGVAVGTPFTGFTSNFSGPPVATQVQIGGLIAPIQASQWPGELNRGANGASYSNVALFDRALTAAEATLLANAFKGWPGESSGARVSRYLAYHYTGAFTAETGASTMGVSALAEDTALLDACQSVAGSENGNFVGDDDGVVVFRSRTSRYLATTAKWVFGELESPYEDGIVFDFDPQRVANAVKITRTGGIVATAVDAASQAAYFPREFSREINVATDNEAVDAATYLLSQMKDPHIRVESITLNPAANPSLWPVALGVEIGDRVTVKRRAITAGVTMTLDFFVEKVKHEHAPGKWVVELQMSPATGTTPWILQDVTYGVLGSTTYLGY